MQRLKAGILGCGGFAHTHARACQALSEQVELVAFCDRNEWKASEFALQYTAGQGTVFTDHHTMLEQPQLDLLIICVPPYGHSDEVQMAAERGIHLLIEKPIALTSEQAWRMVEHAENAGIKTQVGFMYRFGEAVERFKTMQAQGDTGHMGLMSARYFCNALHADWWRDRDRSGGQLVEQVIHMFDLLRYFLGEPESVYSRQENMFHRDMADYTVEDVSATVLGFQGGALGVVYASNGAIPGKWMHDYRIVAHRVMADFTNANHAVFYPTTDKDRAPVTVDSEQDWYVKQMQDLLHAIASDGDTRTPLREGAKSLDVVLAAVRSASARAELRF